MYYIMVQEREKCNTEEEIKKSIIQGLFYVFDRLSAPKYLFCILIPAVPEPWRAVGVIVLPACYSQAECGRSQGQTLAQDGRLRPVRQ